MIKNLLYFFLCTALLTGISACEQSKTTILKVMSYNIKHGEGLDTIIDLSRAANIIKSQSPDLVGLQEIDSCCLRSNNLDQTNYLALQTSMTGTFGKFMDLQNGSYGMATLTAMPIVTSKIVSLPDAKYEPRSTIVQEIKIEDVSILFANVHFDWIDGDEGSGNRLKQAQALVEYINTSKKAAIILGDFNCTPDSPTMTYFSEQGFVFIDKGTDNLSFQIGSKLEIDHVIYRSSEKVQFTSKTIQLLDAPVTSDHRPLVAELQLTY